MRDSIKQRQFEKYTTQTTHRNFNLVFAQTSFALKHNQADIIVYKNGGMVTDNSLSIPEYCVCVNKHRINKFDQSKVLVKQYTNFDQAIDLYNHLVTKYEKVGYTKSVVIKTGDVKKFWKGYFENSVTYRTKGMSDKLIDDIVLAICNVVDKIAINYVQQYRESISEIIDQLGTAKASLRDITNKVTYNSGNKIFNNCFNKWLKIGTELQKSNPVFGNVLIPICTDRRAIDDVTQAFRLYSNYSDRYK